MAKLYAENSMRLALEDRSDEGGEDGRLRDQQGQLIEGAAVEVTITALRTGQEVSGVTWPIVLSDRGGGVYVGMLPHTAALEVGEPYRVKWKAEKNGVVGVWQEIIAAETREYSE